MTEDRVDFEWMLINNKKCAHFTFQNQFTTEIAKNTLQNWDKEFQSNLANGGKNSYIMQLPRNDTVR